MRKASKEVEQEVLRQRQKWGEQNHPLVSDVVQGYPDIAAQEYEIPTAARAQYLCDVLSAHNRVTYTHILLEEFAEFVEAAALGDAAQARAELVQVAAVAVSMIEAIDRNKGAVNADRSSHQREQATRRTRRRTSGGAR